MTPGDERESRPASPYNLAGVAAAYDRLHVAHHFGAPARNLVEALELAPGSRVLDVGSGTGAAALPVTQAVGLRGRVVALDPSPAMLRHVRHTRSCIPVVGAAPRLPFVDGIFDAAIASFSLSHFRSYADGLADITRVLRSGGLLGVSAWGITQGRHVNAWREVISTFVSYDAFAGTFHELVPWDEWFADAENLRKALLAAGLKDVALDVRQYDVAIGVEDFLGMRETSLEGVLVRSNLDPGRWRECQRHAHEVFRSRFPNGLRYTRIANLARARKPG